MGTFAHNPPDPRSLLGGLASPDACTYALFQRVQQQSDRDKDTGDPKGQHHRTLAHSTQECQTIIGEHVVLCPAPPNGCRATQHPT